MGRQTTFPLDHLELDPANPRFGDISVGLGQASILDLIVETFGVDDVLSSLAVNGYFEAEPLVCRELESHKAVVVEGNRRLAACLIIANDPRALHQSERTRRYSTIWEAHGRPGIDPLPVILFSSAEASENLLSYLGVRHISAAQPWDSYAKAVWVSNVVAQENLSIREVALMIGDEHRTIARLLEGYLLMKQLINAGEFDPEASIRRGRGTLASYPFSWVYTILGYSGTRAFLNLADSSDGGVKYPPLDTADVPRGGLLVRSMFGDRNHGRNAAIEDSRDLGSLAAALSDPEKVALLKDGRRLADIQMATAPIESRLRDGLILVRHTQNDMMTGIVERGLPTPEVAETLVDLAARNRRTAREIEIRLRKALEPSDEDMDA